MIVIDDEFRAQIPPLSSDERAQLEQNILNDGIREPLVVWPQVGDGGEMPCILVDGHNRYEIAQKHGLAYEAVQKHFDNRDAAELWILDNQLGRRNLSDYTRGVVALKRKPLVEKLAKERQRGGQGGVLLRQNSDEANRADEAIGKSAGISRDTLRKIERIEADAPSEIKAAAAREDLSINLAAQVIELPKEEQQRIAEAPPDQMRDAAREAVHNHRAQGTGENEWYTPAEYIEAAREFMGAIDLDPASSEFAQATVKAERFFTIDDDGLAQDWRGRVWLNPPYAQPAIAQFVDKTVAEDFDECVMLTHNYTDTAWFHKAMTKAAAVCFTRGRIGFLNPEGKRAAPTQGQAFFYFGARPESFAESFCRFGFVVLPA